MIYEEKFLAALIVTITVETVCLFALLKLFFRIGSDKISNSRIFFTGVFTSFATLPYLWFVLPRFINSAYYIYVGEALVVLVEALIISNILKLKISKSLMISLFCNVASFLLGLFLFRI